MSASLNWIDRAVAMVAPRAALRRLAARDALLAYEGATSDRRTAGWSASGTSANAEIGMALPKLRDRSRDLIRNNHLAATAALNWTTKVIGYGITGRSADEQTNALWDRFTNECSADGLPSLEALQTLVAFAVFESGEVLIRRRWRRASDGLAVSVQLQVLESDFLDINQNRALPNGGYIIQGVEFDPIGRRAAYWLFPEHPGATNMFAGWGRGGASQRVPADDIAHVFEPRRPGQVRGVPRLAPGLMALRDLADWEDAELLRKKTEACLAAFVKTNDDAPLGPTSTETNADGTKRRIEKFRPGMIFYGRPGEDITFNSPQHAGGYEEYKRSRVRDIAAAVGMPYELFRGDYSQSNYSSSRLGFVGFKDIIGAHQWNVIVPALERIKEWFAEGALLNGVTVSREFEWAPPPFDMLDRGEEAKADAMSLQLGGMTWPQYIQRNGMDPAKQIAEISQWKDQLRAAGIVFGKENNVGQPATQPAAA